MLYKSTRGNGKERYSFLEVLLKGLAEDGGLFVPERIPKFCEKDLRELWTTTKPDFVKTAFMVIREFISEAEINSDDLWDIITRSYATFQQESVAPLQKLEPSERWPTGVELYLLELFHGPTFAFKDVALQLLGNLFEFALVKNRREGRLPVNLAIIGATSGDTGSAAIYGVRGKSCIKACILFPQGRVSPIQQAQMTSIRDKNVLNVAIAGTFDDCQDVVKRCFVDTEFQRRLGATETALGAVNSINWARIMAQISYYFYSYHSLVHKLGEFPSVVYSVPTGNFGDVLAGFYSWRMGLSLDKLFVATNCNDILDRFLKSGDYSRKGEQATASCSPAMDILVSSNFERLLYHAAGSRSPQRFAENEADTNLFDSAGAGESIRRWMDELTKSNTFSVDLNTLKRVRSIFLSSSVSDTDTMSTIREYLKTSTLVDPHTAVGLCAAERLVASLSSPPKAVVCLSTAHPGKFGDTIAKATNGELQLGDYAPKALLQLENLPKQYVDVAKSDAGETSLLTKVKSLMIARFVDTPNVSTEEAVTRLNDTCIKVVNS